MITNFNQFETLKFVDKRTDTKPKEVIQKAVDEIRSLGYKNPFDNTTVIDDNVLVGVSNFDGYLILQSIMTIDKGRGDASRILKKICDIADKYQVTMTLTPKPFGTGKILTMKQLKEWYGRFGFKKYQLEDMKRNPIPLSEKQLKLFNFEEPTDSELAHTFISKHKRMKPFHRPTKFSSLQQALKSYTDFNEKYLNDIIFEELNNCDPNEAGGYYGDILMNNQDNLIDFILKYPRFSGDKVRKIANSYQRKKTSYQDAYDEIEEIMRNESWYYHLDEFVTDTEKFKDWFVKKHRNNLIGLIDTEYLDELKSAIYDSKDDNKLLIYRAITLPDTIDSLEDLNYNGVGEYWTYDFDKAEAYWSNHNREFILSAYADVNCIDWETTVHHTLYHLREEREVKIWDGADLELISVFMKDYYSKTDMEQERKRVSQMFHYSNSNNVYDYIQGRLMNLSTITFEEPVVVVA